MAKLETFVDLHDSLVTLLQTMDRRRLIELLSRVIDLTLPANFTVEERTPTVDFPGLGRHRKKRIADLVLVVKTDAGRVLVTFVIEVQESWSLGKGHDWMIFAVAFASRHDRKAQVMVVAPKPRLRRRIRRLLAQIDEPIQAIELDHIERIDDDDLARLWPHETILGALYCADEDTLDEDLRVAAVRAALIALEKVDDSNWLSYLGLIMATAPPAIGERALELATESGSLDAERLAANWEYMQGSTLHEWAKREGREEGREEGRAAALRLVIRELLVVREADTAELQRRIENCADPATLERWFRTLMSSRPDIRLSDIFT